jgi:hypothetical protein
MQMFVLPMQMFVLKRVGWRTTEIISIHGMRALTELRVDLWMYKQS